LVSAGEPQVRAEQALGQQTLIKFAQVEASPDPATALPTKGEWTRRGSFLICRLGKTKKQGKRPK
jgi:hypothetical protein